MILCTLTALWTAFIWYNSTVSGEGSGALSRKVTEFFCSFAGEVSEEAFDSAHHFIRKAAHFTEFCLLGLLYGSIRRSLDGKVISSLIFFPVSCTLFTAVCDEFIQSFTGRGSSVRDVMLDFSGALTGIAITVIFAVVIGRKHNAKH